MSLKRPFVPLCAVALISVLLCRFSYFLLLALPVFIVAFGIYSVRKGGKKRVYTGLCVVMLFLSFYPPIYEVFHAAKKVPYADDAEYRGVVTEISYGKYTATAYVRITDGPYRSETCRIRIPHDWAQPALFDTIRFYGNVLPSHKAESGTALYRLYAKDARLCAARLYGWNPVETEAKDHSFRKSVYFLLRERLSELFDGDTCAMAMALLTGDRTGLSDARTEAFRRAGLYPFLCISGVHVMLTTGLLRKLLRKIHTPKAVQIPILLAFLAAFAVIGGASGSILRASIMAAVMWIAPICMREYDSVSALCFAFLILWLKNPYMIYDLGIELSFAATLGVIMAGELQKICRIRDWDAAYFRRLPLRYMPSDLRRSFALKTSADWRCSDRFPI